MRTAGSALDTPRKLKVILGLGIIYRGVLVWLLPRRTRDSRFFCCACDHYFSYSNAEFWTPSVCSIM